MAALENEKGKAAEKVHEKARLAIQDRLTQLAPQFLLRISICWVKSSPCLMLGYRSFFIVAFRALRHRSFA